MAKTTKPTAQRAFKSKKAYVQEDDPQELSFTRSWADYGNPNCLLNNPTCDKWRVERFIYTLYKWAARPDSLERQQFCNLYKIHPQTFDDWVRDYPDVAFAYKQAKLMIAANRRIGSITKELDGKWAHNDLYLYDPITKEVDKYQRDNKLAEMMATSGIVYGVPATQPKVQTEEEFKKEVNAII